MKNRKTVVITAAILLVAVISCGVVVLGQGQSKSPVKNEAEIRKDVIANDPHFEEYGVRLDSMTIEKRMTEEKYRSDHVWLHITASNEYTVYTASYEIIYSLYNEGWLLDNVLDLENGYREKRTVTSAEAEEFMKTVDCARFEFRNQISYESKKLMYFYYNIWDENDERKVYGIRYSFDPKNGWFVDDQEIVRIKI